MIWSRGVIETSTRKVQATVWRRSTEGRSTVKRIWSYEGLSPNTPVNDFRLNGKKYQITNYMIIKSIQTTVDTMADDNLGFSKDDIGTHSIRSGGAMALCLAKVEVYTITIIGRWKSDAFMRYIRKQVQQFTTDLSNRMLQVEHFNHIPKDRKLRL